MSPPSRCCRWSDRLQLCCFWRAALAAGAADTMVRIATRALDCIAGAADACALAPAAAVAVTSAAGAIAWLVEGGNAFLDATVPRTAIIY